MRMMVLAAGTPAEVQRALALAEELARREQLQVQRQLGAVGSLIAGMEEAEVRCLFDHPSKESHGDARSTIPEGERDGDDPKGRELLAAAHDGTWFLFRGRHVDLSARRVLARVLTALLQARMATPGIGLRPSELVAAAWPNEQMGEKSAVNRLRVALSTLRRLGLRDVLASRDGAISIDATIEVLNVVDEPSGRAEG